ncbi:MAG: protein kinase domain-containing protein [Dysosmobacter welbionis]
MEHKDPYIGKMLDNRYEILERIGTGGMAIVYKAKCHRLNRLVAVKILKSDLAQDEDFRCRFNAESQAVAQLSHPNIVSVYDVSKGGDIEYIVMELIDGITLKQYMEKRGQLNWRESLHFITQIMRGLSHAHSRGIVHRDIKPQNVMVLRDGSVKVADFGIACLENAAQTLTQEALGSVHYISPEQARGDRTDARSDIYSAGVVLYEMLTGRLPFEGDSAVSVAIQHLSSVPLAPREVNPDIPEQLELICMKAMAPDLEKRYPSADAMIADLEAFRKNPGVNLDFELSDLRPEETDEPTQKLRSAVPPQLHRQGQEPSYERGRRWEEDRYEDEQPSRLSGGKKIALIGGGAVVVVVVLFFLFRAIFASFVPAAPDTYHRTQAGGHDGGAGQ